MPAAVSDSLKHFPKPLPALYWAPFTGRARVQWRFPIALPSFRRSRLTSFRPASTVVHQRASVHVSAWWLATNAKNGSANCRPKTF